MTFDVEMTRDDSCFALPDWAELRARDPDRHVFSTPEWNRLWWDEFGAGKDLWVLTLRRAGKAVAVVPLYRKLTEEPPPLRFVGGVDLTDYLGPICAPEDREEVAETLLLWLGDAELEWAEFDAHNMAVPFGFAEFLVDHADRQGFDIALTQEETTAVLRLPGDWDSYLQGLRAKERHELKRKRRRIQRELPDASVRTSTDETLDRDLKIFIEMHRGTEGHKGHFMRPDIATFFERIAHDFMPRGWLRVDLLEVGGTAIAATFAFELERTLYLYNSAYEPEAGRLSPGLILVSELVKGAIEKGFTTFDFLRGPERYKYDLGAQALPLNRLRIANPRLG
ncbi:MAG: GNAT family N-acetyltransferase [Actinomycetota bacterium]